MLIYHYVRLVMIFRSFVCFFFKQKTAYEMRISDWSSDVCSSDLNGRLAGRSARARGRLGQSGRHTGLCHLLARTRRERRPDRGVPYAPRGLDRRPRPARRTSRCDHARRHRLHPHPPRPARRRGRPRRLLRGEAARAVGLNGARRPASVRSEEHTSELQSLMRISYAVFCLKKKNILNQTAYMSLAGRVMPNTSLDSSPVAYIRNSCTI